MQIPVLNGIYTDEASDFRTSYPRNLVPVPKEQGISHGYLRPADGIVAFSDEGPGLDRGGINWNGVCYRVMGAKLVEIGTDGTITVIGDVGGTGSVTLDYSFDYLGIASNNNLYLYNGTTLQQVTDPDLGAVLDHIWVDGYFMTTDGEYLIVTELNDPFSVLATKYGSSEADPDPIKAIVKLRNEPYALNRYTIEVFDNIGGSGFPFQRIDGAQIQRGVIGTHACCVFLESVAFVGSGRNEPAAVWLAASGSSVKISTREIDQVLLNYSEAVLEDTVVEARVDKGHQHLYVHLPDQTLVYDGVASQLLGEHVWFTLSSGLTGDVQYRARYLIWCYDKWLVGDTSTNYIGYFTDESSAHWGETIGWEFNTMIIYNEGRGAIFHELELVCLSGRAALGVDPTISTQYSLDGESWSMVRFIKAGKQGQRKKRLVWLNQGSMRHWRIQRFNGTSDSHLAVARLEARVEPLMV
jgi:hypothetical protein